MKSIIAVKLVAMQLLVAQSMGFCAPGQGMRAHKNSGLHARTTRYFTLAGHQTKALARIFKPGGSLATGQPLELLQPSPFASRANAITLYNPFAAGQAVKLLQPSPFASRAHEITLYNPKSNQPSSRGHSLKLLQSPFVFDQPVELLPSPPDAVPDPSPKGNEIAHGGDPFAFDQPMMKLIRPSPLRWDRDKALRTDRAAQERIWLLPAPFRGSPSDQRPATGGRESGSTSRTSWTQKLDSLVAYKAEHGDLFVPYDFVTSDGVNLGTWVRYQRLHFKKGMMDVGKTEKLKEIGFIFSPRSEVWEKHFRALRAYQTDHGDCLVPSEHVTEEGAALGFWVNNQRHRLKAGTLQEERQRKLMSIGFALSTQSSVWDEHFAALTSYRLSEGDCLVRKNHVTADGLKLGMWASNQRSAFRRGALDLERHAKLKGLGFAFDARSETWQRNFALLRAYRAKHSNCMVPQQYVTENGANLGTWVSTQRVRFKKGVLSEIEYAMLASVGFTFHKP